MEPKIIKEKWRVEFTMGPESTPFSFCIDARGPQDARMKGERVMQKDWGNRGYSWHFVGSKTIEDK